MAGVTDRLRLGTCVTNPGTREPTVTASSLATLDELSEGRMDLGIGRGDSARRVLGKPPITLAHTEEAIRVIRALVAGETIAYEGTDLQFPWTRGWTLPVWVAGYGPHGPRDDRSRRGRAHPAARRSGSHPLVRRAGAGRGDRCRARSGEHPDPGRGAGPRRPHATSGASGHAGSRPSSPTTSSTWSTSTRAISCPRRSPATSPTARATTTGITPRSARRTRRSSATR